ncbi:MAG: hypothetical protein HY594_02255 [Candidatus Omnitrophica bacterium]|nr:hypothetical protein [Candidatus Omnitrophota bacterium]
MSWVALAFVAAGTLVRFLPHPMNMTPIVALALFSGRHFPARFALVLTLATMLIGDIAKGWVVQNLMGYVSLGLIVAAGAVLRRRRATAWTTALAATPASSLAFFLLSNFGVWLEGRLYPLDQQGLIACYVAGVPFFRNQLLGDLLFVAVLFGGFQWVTRSLEKMSPIRGSALR